MHPIEIQEALKNMTLLCDTREQNTTALQRRIDQIGWPVERVALKSGDYSARCLLPDGEIYSLADAVTIERKMSADELANNFTRGRKRFTNEFDRFISQGGKIYLLVEGTSYKDIMQHHYRSLFEPKAYLASMFTWCSRYNTIPVFCDAADSGYIIKSILYYEMRERLEKRE